MGALAAIRSAVPLLVGLILGIFGATVYAGIVTLPAAREAGAQSERIVQEEERRQAEARAADDRRTAQAAIDAVEREYYERDKARVEQMSALEAALEKEKANEAPVAGRPGACRPAIPRGVRDALDAAGRAAPARPAPAKPDAALR